MSSRIDVRFRLLLLSVTKSLLALILDTRNIIETNVALSMRAHAGQQVRQVKIRLGQNALSNATGQKETRLQRKRTGGLTTLTVGLTVPVTD